MESLVFEREGEREETRGWIGANFPPMTPVKRCLRNIWTMLPSSFVLHPFCASHSTLFKPTFETLLSCLSFPLRVDTIFLFRALMSDKGIVLGRERERSVNFVRVFATLEIYFRIILLIRKNFPQEKIIPLSKILMVFFLIRSIWKIYQALLSWISGNLFTSEGTY